MMSNLYFKDRLDSELEHIEFTVQSKQKVLEQIQKFKKAQNASDTQNRLESLRSAVYNSDRISRQELELKQTYALWLERINGFLETELRIPVKPLAVALLITLSGFIYGFIGAAGVSAEEVQKSSITVMDGTGGGQADELYKD